MKKIFYMAISLVVLSLALFGCKPSQSKNTLVVNLSTSPGSLDVNKSSGEWEHWLFSNIFEGMVSFDVNGKVVAGQAKDWTVSKDGKTYTFNLKDTQWSDGVPVTAHDFEFALKRLLNPETAAIYAPLLWMIKGGEAYNTGKGKAEDVAITALNDKTLQIVLNTPASYFVELLEHPVFYPIPKHVVEKYGKDWVKVENLVYNGAYMLTEYKPQSHLMAVKNPKYWGANDVSIEQIKFALIDDPEAAFKAFKTGEVDFAYGFPAERLEEVKKDLDGQWYIYPQTVTSYLSVNMVNPSNPALKNKEIRHALAMTIDRDFIVEKISYGLSSPAYEVVPASLYEPVFTAETAPKVYWATWSMEKRIATAKSIMKKYGFSKEKPLTFRYQRVAKGKKTGSIAIAKMWEEIGVKVEFQEADTNVFYNNMQTGNYDVSGGGWVADYQEPSTMLYVLESNSANNYGPWKNAEFDKLVAQAKATNDITTRMKLYAKAEQIALDDAALLPTFHSVNNGLYSKRLVGFKPYLAGTYLFKHYTLAN